MVFAIILIGFFYAVPNLYGEDPALQVSGTNGNPVTAEVAGEVENLLKSKTCPKDPDLRSDLSIILQDIASLINHISFTFERLEYMQDTVVGIINLDQNRIMKLFTFVSLLLMPATLVASFYGMNVALPLSDRWWAWIGVVLLMLLLVLSVWLFFKKKRML